MDKLITFFEKSIIIVLLITMGALVAILTFEMSVVLITEIVRNNDEVGIIINTDEVIVIFGFFINILIGLELFETVKLYLRENVFHPEIILMISLIAILRKVIVIDFKEINPITAIAIALLIGAITTGYYFLKKAVCLKRSCETNDNKKQPY